MTRRTRCIAWRMQKIDVQDPLAVRRPKLRERIAFVALCLLPALLLIWICFLIWWAGWMLALWP